MTLLIETPPGRESERRYVVDLTVRQWLGLDYTLRIGASPGTVRITISGTSGAVRMPDVLFAMTDRDWLSPSSLPATPPASQQLPDWLPANPVGSELPALYGASGPAATRDGSHSLAFGADLFGAIFFLVTRYEELVIKQRDRHDRFPAGESAAGRAACLDRPLADEYAQLLAAGLRAMWPSLDVPAPAAGRVVLTHDIDLSFASRHGGAWRLGRGIAADIVKRGDLPLAARRATSFLRSRLGRYPRGDPFDTYDELMQISERHGLSSAFYFLAIRSDGPTGGDYGLDELWVRRLLRRIADRGHEIGLHTSYASMGSRDAVATEFALLREAAAAAGVEQDAWGARAHFLRWQPSSWETWEAAGLQYDSSVGFAEMPGFRCGTGRPFHVYDLARRTPLRLVERPLLVMDATLFSYQQLPYAEALDTALQVAARSRRFGGDAVILWHNSSLVSREQRSTYQALVAGLTR